MTRLQRIHSADCTEAGGSSAGTQIMTAATALIFTHLIAFVTLQHAAHAQSAFYKGKTITIVQGRAPAAVMSQGASA